MYLTVDGYCSKCPQCDMKFTCKLLKCAGGLSNAKEQPMTDPLKPGWLQRQFDNVTRDVAQWPEYMKREAGFTMTDPRDVRIAQLENALRACLPQIWRCSSWDCCNRGHEDCAYGMARAALTPKPDAPPAPYGQGSGPLPGKNVTVVQTGDKTLFITAPDAPCHEWPVTAPAPRPADSDRIETLEGALRKANDRLAAIHRAYQNGVHPRVNRLVDELPALIAEGEKALRGEESEECPNCANPPHDGPCRRKIQKEPTC